MISPFTLSPSLDGFVPDASPTEVLLLPPLPEGQDATPWIRTALQQCRRSGIRRLILPGGTLHFYPDLAEEQYLFISNNDEGLKRIAFLLEGFDEFEIDGGHSLLIFHGAMLPVVIKSSAKITIRNLQIDWARTFHSEALIVDAQSGTLDLEIPSIYPHAVENERLIFHGEGGLIHPIDNVLEFDSRRRETAFKVFDNFGIGGRHQARQLGPGLVRFYADFAAPAPQAGNILALIDERRLCPAFTFDQSRSILMENVTLFHAGGMGFIGQLSHDITLRKCRVKPASGRMISLRADATHFVCCSGELVLEDCEFSHQLDDAGNFHGVYTPIVRRISARAAQVRLNHFQQWGLQAYAEGHEIEFVNRRSLARIGTGEIATVHAINREYVELHFTRDLPGEAGPDWAVGNLSWQPDVTIRRTRVHSNRARGYLVTTAGKVIIEDNYLHTPGAALLIEGDCDFWCESGAVNDVQIRRNLFENCNYGVWGRATIDINPKIEADERPARFYHRNICVAENEFQTFHDQLVQAHYVDGLAIRDNTIQMTSSYPGPENSETFFRWENCRGVEEMNNTISTPARAVMTAA